MESQGGNDIVRGRKNIRALLGGAHWTTIERMIQEDGYPICIMYGRWQCSKYQVEVHHRRLQAARSPNKAPETPVNP